MCLTAAALAGTNFLVMFSVFVVMETTILWERFSMKHRLDPSVANLKELRETAP
jgi:hypothetical protein